MTTILKLLLVLLLVGILPGRAAFAQISAPLTAAPVAAPVAAPGAPFNVEAATQAYLNTLTPAQKAKSDAYFVGVTGWSCGAYSMRWV